MVWMIVDRAEDGGVEEGWGEAGMVEGLELVEQDNQEQVDWED